jgi:hypothetical protein
MRSCFLVVDDEPSAADLPARGRPNQACAVDVTGDGADRDSAAAPEWDERRGEASQPATSAEPS